MPLDHSQKRRRDRIGARLAAPLIIKDLAPPLQADFAGQGFARHLAHPRNFDIEGEERMKRVAMLSRCEQRGEKTIAIGLPDKLSAIGKRRSA